MYDASNDAAGAIVVSSGGKIVIYGHYNPPDRLTIYQDSTINGEVEIYAGSSTNYGALVLAGNVTITGTGVIEGYDDEARIENSDSTVRTLTIPSGFTIEGALESKAKIVNNGSVIAEDGTLKLTAGGEGSGVWSAHGSTGVLQVAEEVTGSGTWQLTDDAGAKIVIDAESICLGGDVIVNKGTLDINEAFKTTGDLSLSSVDALIDVAANKTAKFSGTLPMSCQGG